jgi:NADPH:quinone reductase-like Zn-dependent oxidoreductase
MTVPLGMRAIVLDGSTASEELRTVEIPTTVYTDRALPGDVRALAINPSDVLTMRWLQ